MTAKRFLLAVLALTLMLPLCGCHHKQRCCGERSYAPPATGCCPTTVPPGAIPSPVP